MRKNLLLGNDTVEGKSHGWQGCVLQLYQVYRVHRVAHIPQCTEIEGVDQHGLSCCATCTDAQQHGQSVVKRPCQWFGGCAKGCWQPMSTAVEQSAKCGFKQLLLLHSAIQCAGFQQ